MVTNERMKNHLIANNYWPDDINSIFRIDVFLYINPEIYIYMYIYIYIYFLGQTKLIIILFHKN